ncbi:hypothetical protein EDD15DRAFT_2358711 [Pisolithus albus]|nr:hypothetical protein EDD15DRAFT_2358711 [Pisolithus albus]
MSSSSSYRPSHLHRVNLQSNRKRLFEEYGYDSDPDPSSLNSGTQPSVSGSSGSSHHFSSGSSSSTGAGDGGIKELEVQVVPPTAVIRHRPILSGPSALARDAVDCPISARAFFGSQDGGVANLNIELPHSTFTEGIPETSSVSSEDNLCSSLQRFNEFKRHIAALRTSIATSRRSLLPQMGSSEHATHEDWHAGPSTFQSMTPMSASLTF